MNISNFAPALTDRTCVIRLLATGAVTVALVTWAMSAAAYPIASPFPGTGTKETLTVVGAITQQQGIDSVFNPGGAAPPPGLSVGTPFTLTVTYDSAEVYYPSTQIPNAALYGWTAYPLANGDTFNSVTLSAGPYTWHIADQLCANPSIQPTCGQQFPYGPTLLLRDGHFAGLDSFLGATTQSVFALEPALDNLGTPFAQATDGPLRAANAAANPPIANRADNVYFGQTSNFDITLVGHYDINPFFSGVPEPAAWATLILGVAMVGFAARRRNWLDVRGWDGCGAGS